MSIPTKGETYSKIMEHLRKLQEDTAMMAHLAAANDDRKLSNQWLHVSERFKDTQRLVTLLAMKGSQ